SADLAEVFGEALAPLIQACIRLMYLGVMGWIGSLLTVRGIPLVTQKTVPITTETRTTHAPPQPKPQLKSQSKPEKLTPTPGPENTYSQKTSPKSQPETPRQQKSQLIPEPKQEEPKAILITPENQKEE
ncbi:MAG: hypothetical protein NWE78_03475, partial [Candidatus Bathyarchaeota archaeon]|nr:hypothetical protein [Candidatus Bathyarchaeota archaeon]